MTRAAAFDGAPAARFVQRFAQLGGVFAAGLRVALVRHPMPYHDLDRIAVQRFATLAEIDASNPTIEEREEYEPHLDRGSIVFAEQHFAVGEVVDRHCEFGFFLNNRLPRLCRGGIVRLSHLFVSQ